MACGSHFQVEPWAGPLRSRRRSGKTGSGCSRLTPPVCMRRRCRRLLSLKPANRRPLAEVMARLVMKFGGTAVADIDRIRNVARHVKREVDAGHEVAVVVSAMAGTTNQLVGWWQ